MSEELKESSTKTESDVKYRSQRDMSDKEIEVTEADNSAAAATSSAVQKEDEQ